MSEEGNWIELKVDTDYEINDVYPHQIRRKANHRIVSESVEKPRGYLICHLNRKKYDKHRLIAIQWVKNTDPDKFKFVDHVNHNRVDNRVENLRWVTCMANNNNRYNQSFVEELPEDALVVDEYNGNRFENLYFYRDTFYFYNGINYTIRPRRLNNWGVYTTRATDVTGVRRTIAYTTFKRQYGLID